MILQALAKYYETLCERGVLSVPGWNDAVRVTLGIDLNDKGEIVRLIDFREEQQKGKKTVVAPRPMRVPERVVRSSGAQANFLCDNAIYLLGLDVKGDADRAILCFTVCRTLHEQLLSPLQDPEAKALLAFFKNWNPEDAAEHPQIEPFLELILKGGNLVFCYDGKAVTENPAIQDAWQAHYDKPDPNAKIGQCLLTGEMAPIAVIHPKIKGVMGAQSTGASLSSFNCPSFCSYGQTQNYNAPVSERAAFAYTTALNSLLADRNHCRIIGDTTIVCWAEHGDPDYQDVYFSTLFGSADSDDTVTVTDFLQRLTRGESLEWNGIELNEDEHFYILGLSPNAARISVRFFLQDSFGALLRNIQKHYDDFNIAKPSFDIWERLPMWKIIQETVNEKSNNKNPNPSIPGELLRAVLTDSPYPASLLQAAQIRIRAERNITRGRAAIIKAYYTRAKDTNFPKEVLSVELNPNSTDIPYTLGRLFSIYEQIQEQAFYPNKVNTTVKDKFFVGAAASPAYIFPHMGNLAQYHLKKLSRKYPKSAAYYDRVLTEFSLLIGTSYPATLSIEEQASFQLGYYHQNHERYQSKKNLNKTNESEE